MINDPTNHTGLEPLDPVAWLAGIVNLRASLDGSPEAQTESSLRRLYHLLRLTPAPLRPLFDPVVSEEFFERLLAGSKDLAAVCLLGQTLEYDLKRGAPGVGYLVVIRFPHAIDAVRSSDGSLSKAILTGLCDLIQGLAQDRSSAETSAA